MKKIAAFLLSVMCISTIIPANAISAQDTEDYAEEEIILYVSPDGEDTAAGTEQYPLKSFEGARDRVRSLLKKQTGIPITVIFKEGEYRFSRSVELNAFDSGVEGAEITYKAEEGADVKFKGSVLLDVSEFEYINDESILARIPDVARDYVGALDLSKFNISNVPVFGGGGGGNRPTKYYDIYLDDELQTLSRYPNTGYIQINEIVDQNNCIFRPAGSRVSRWGAAKDVQMSGYISNTYAYDRTYITNIDTQNRTLQFFKGYTTGGLTNVTNRFFVSNLLEEIDVPGEWFIDKDTMILYYYPPHPLSDETLEMSVLREDMITIKDASYITFDGIEFSQTCRDVIGMVRSSHITVRNCLFRNIGRSAITNDTVMTDMILSDGCDNVLIENNTFYEIGGECARLGGGDFRTLEPSNNRITNNHAYHYQTYSRYGYAFAVSGVGSMVDHNTIHDAPHGGVNFSGNDHKILYNEMYDLCKESNDCGAIYSGRNVFMRGVEIAYNYIHDINILDTSVGTIQCAVYYDDRLSEGYVHHNIIKNCGRGIFLHGGCDMTIENNILIDMDSGISFSHCGTGFENLYYEAFNVLNQYPVYSKYRGMSEEELFAREDDFYPKGNYCTDNLFVNPSGAGVQTTENVHIGDGIDENKIFDNVVETSFDDFVDPENQDYTIKDGADILNTIPGLNEIKMSEIGIYDKDSIELDPEQTFLKTAPKNNEKNVESSSAIFAWENVEKADRYRLVIATDPQLENVVYDEEVFYNTITLDSLDSGNVQYYWDVVAYSNSKDGGTEIIESTGAPYLLTTSKYDNLDKLILTETIQNAESLYSELEVGTAAGQSSEEDVQAFRDAIDSAIEVNNLKVGIQADVDKAANDLDNAIRTVSSKRNLGYFGIDGMLADIDNWTLQGNQDSYISDNVMYLKEHASYDEKIDTYKVLKFKMKVSYNTSGWTAFGIKQAAPGIVWSGGTGYFWAFKADQFEYQRFVEGAGGFLQDAIPNTYLTPDVWHDIEIASTDVQNGVWNYLKVDDQYVLNVVDESGYISDAGLFQIYCFGDIEIEVMPADNLPETFDRNIMTSGGADRLAAVDPVVENLNKAFNAVDGSVENIDGGVLLKKAGSDVFASADKLDGNEILRFNAIFNFADSQQAMGIRMNAPQATLQEADGYYVTINNDNIILERSGTDGNIILGIVQNKYIKSGEKVNIEFGAYPVEEGMRIILYADGEKIFDYADAYSKHEAGYFTLYDISGYGISIMD